MEFHTRDGVTGCVHNLHLHLSFHIRSGLPGQPTGSVRGRPGFTSAGSNMGCIGMDTPMVVENHRTTDHQSPTGVEPLSSDFPMNADPLASRARRPSAMKAASFSSSFHFIVLRVGSKS